MEEKRKKEDLKQEQAKARKPSVSQSTNPKSTKAPVKVKPVPRLSRDLSALHRLFCDKKPPHRLVRDQLIHAVKYTF